MIKKEDWKNSKVIDTNILGVRKEESKLFLVNWYYCANFGTDLYWAENLEDLGEMIFYDAKKVRFQITEVNPENMPVIVGGQEMYGGEE